MQPDELLVEREKKVVVPGCAKNLLPKAVKGANWSVRQFWPKHRPYRVVFCFLKSSSPVCAFESRYSTLRLSTAVCLADTHRC